MSADTFDQDGRQISPEGEQHTGQVRIAYRLARSHIDRLLHVHGIGWHHYDGTRWVEDTAGHARRAVLDVLRDALAESVGDKQLRADVAKCESASGIDGVLSVASALVEFAATVQQLDADPFLLNCANGTLDLRTRELRDHDPADRLSRVTVGAWSDQVDNNTWVSFLASILPDEAERDYLQRVVGQAVYGQVQEHLFPVLIGTGANGKSTAYGAIVDALGDYATVIDPALLMVRERGGVGGPELMQLLGARLVVGSETGDGSKLDEAAMKRMTGGDTITARRLYREPVTWQPSHQLLYVSNHLPAVRGNDPAVWRRLRVIPFEVVVPEAKRDPRLPETLRLHADAILFWCVAGYFDYCDGGGMREPATVLRATDAYQSDSDDVARFVAEACHVANTAAETTRRLYAAWQKWAIAEGVEPIAERTFGKELDRLGYESKRTKLGATRAGLMPSDSPELQGW
ncbi:phage/plasmid primase, P4 family [Allobranchiibius sp. GilTou73]|uniref:DNA primase family protein n=1 Tax=Allobranchiibius sp. GilTou73 TaxID=2904523 RepID=UPI001F2F6C48|nr:phage/plasmid primase, P4 family [Allobranchiibius sp. GilTou73]UIJ34500.1 phage/plasmid primase, P4 family [Allobranchiibius sp. GilTou73]